MSQGYGVPVVNGRKTTPPLWIYRLWAELLERNYTGPITLHCKDGQVQKVVDSRTRDVKEFDH